MRPVLLVPGFGNSGPGHWQSLWEAKHPGVARVVQRAWENPVCPDPTGPAFPAVASGFASVPPALRKYRVTVVSSDDDPYAATSHTEEQVAAWGAEHVRLARCGHINAASGLGDWPDGWALVERWLEE